MDVEALRELNIPHQFTRKELVESDYHEMELSELERVKLGKVIEVLSHPGLTELIDDGKLTFAMIRPRADLNRRGLSDVEAAEAIARDIRAPLEVVFSISARFERKMIDELYDEKPKVTQRELAAMKYPDKFNNRWEEFADLMSSGAVTVLLLFSPGGKAIQLWREQIGHLDIAVAKEGTLRKTWAIDTYNNLLHGSDSPDAVRRELGVLLRLLHSFVPEKERSR